MVNIVVSGVPKAVKLPKFLNFLTREVFQEYREYVINYTKPLYNGLRQISFNMKSNDARKALRFLCNYQYIHANTPYTLQCWIEEGRGGEYEGMFNNYNDEPMRRDHDRGFNNYEPSRKNRRYSESPMQSDSRSAHCSSELREIELKIDLVRKQRILMEEETKLLIERKKLEFLQNIGDNDYAKLAMFDEICKRNDPNEISEFVETLNSKTIKKKPMAGGKLPNFLGPCKEITSQMHAMIRSHPDIDEENRTVFWKLLRSTLKKRLAVVLEDEGYLSTSQIVTLYRTIHPKTTDNALVNELIKTISTSCWPKKNKGKKIETAKAIDEGQKNESENPDTDAKELIKTDKPTKPVELDELVDMENDVENWEDEDAEIGKLEDDDEEVNKTVADFEPKITNKDVKEAEEANIVSDEQQDVAAEDDIGMLENVILDRVGDRKQTVEDYDGEQEPEELTKEMEQ